ncbi:lytic transglycosylase domain-containing protein [Alcaligenes faecalis]|uniref:lytic transglycosylase domain-containing protein n=1 Tax=Alcaligenes TaxID=507 RepID=UPI00203F52B4|nr:lytic transglycosylase domain-containing protein [Alcaligenes faecalis]MCM2559009.1 lytic transglycosylase domain-containing protein [Alcaligenes faecalis]MCM2623025.1 lytic transglycosylase domain-containing protein [Alcaligenes faecalis]MCX5473021.1 lytic transglycosylase domain-containing protein [Alcaligenes nematophilus]
MLAEIALLAATCAPNIHETTLSALVRHESTAQVYAIGINKGKRLEQQPTDYEQAAQIANDLIERGIDFDAGLGQINVRNWAWLGLTTETVFDPCTNLQAAQTVLMDCYERALRQSSDEQRALRSALSCYNTGNFERGFSNGYVGKVLAQAGIKVPAIKAMDDEPVMSTAKSSARKAQRTGIPDGFTRNRITEGSKSSEDDMATPANEPDLAPATVTPESPPPPLESPGGTPDGFGQHRIPDGFSPRGDDTDRSAKKQDTAPIIVTAEPPTV